MSETGRATLRSATAGAPELPLPADRQAIGWLIAANAFTLMLALAQDWPLALLLWPYWLQSVLIGAYSVRRILGLRQFSTEGFLINRRAVEPTEQTKCTTALFFTLHYGVFHAVYALFLVRLQMPAHEWLWVGVAGLAFLLNHGHSFRRYREADRQGRPNIGTLMFLPYLRVLPMHLTMMIGTTALDGSAGALLLFGALKTAADCAMHVAEHRILAAAGRPVR